MATRRRPKRPGGSSLRQTKGLSMCDVSPRFFTRTLTVLVLLCDYGRSITVHRQTYRGLIITIRPTGKSYTEKSSVGRNARRETKMTQRQETVYNPKCDRNTSTTLRSVRPVPSFAGPKARSLEPFRNRSLPITRPRKRDGNSTRKRSSRTQTTLMGR